MYISSPSFLPHYYAIGHRPTNHRLVVTSEQGDMSVIIGKMNHWTNGDRPITLLNHDRLRHVYVVGQTGTGKSTLLKNSIIQDIDAGEGVGFIDPHGDDAEELLNHIPARRARDVIYFNPADVSWPMPFNPLKNVTQDDRHRVASNILSSFKSIFQEAWGSGRMEYITYNALVTLLDYPDSTLLDLSPLLTDAKYREKVLLHFKDPYLRKHFWEEDFNRWDKRYRTEAITPIKNKIGQFLSSSILRNILGQRRDSIDFRRIIDGKQIFIANLSKGKLGENKSRLLGSLLVSQFHLAAMQRADIPANQRVPFYLHIDEFQSFATDSFASILSEARKFALSLTIAHQFISQLDGLEEAVFGNVGTTICFRVGTRDAETLAPEFYPFTRENITELPNGQALIRPLVNGTPSQPLKINSLGPIDVNYSQKERFIALVRERRCTPREVVERIINKELRK